MAFTFCNGWKFPCRANLTFTNWFVCQSFIWASKMSVLLNLVKALAQTFPLKLVTCVTPLPTLLMRFGMNWHFLMMISFFLWSTWLTMNLNNFSASGCLPCLMFSNEDEMNFSILKADLKTSPFLYTHLSSLVWEWLENHRMFYHSNKLPHLLHLTWEAQALSI